MSIGLWDNQVEFDAAMAERAATADQCKVRLRPYQVEQVEAVEKAWNDYQSTLVVAATGTGKTTTLSAVIGRNAYRGKALVVAHRRELIDQLAQRIYRITGLRVEIEQADRWADHKNADVVVASVQTLNAGMGGDGRITRFEPSEFGVFVCDEAHHAVAPSYVKVIDHIKQNVKVKILGVTATPDRADEAALGRVFQSVAHTYEIDKAVADGWLVGPRQMRVHVEGLDLSSVHTSDGDFNQGELEAVLMQEIVLHRIASPTVELAKGRQTLIFAASVAHAEKLAEIINRHHPESARWVCGDTPPQERTDIFRDFQTRRYQFLVNVGVVTEGVDLPGVEVVVLARPTKSRALFCQMVGRGLRPAAEIADLLVDYDAQGRVNLIANSAKPFVEVIDFKGNVGKHELVCLADILGGNYDDDVVERAKAKAEEQQEKTGKPADIAEELEKAKAEIEKREAMRAAAIAKRSQLKPVAHYSTQIVDAFCKFNIVPEKMRGWDAGQLATDKQVDCLFKMFKGKTPRQQIAAMSRKHATQLLNEHFKRPTDAQAYRLRNAGIRTDIDLKRASRIIPMIRSNGTWLWANQISPATRQQIDAILNEGSKP